MDEEILRLFRQRCVEYICINNYSIAHARLIMRGGEIGSTDRDSESRTVGDWRNCQTLQTQTITLHIQSTP